MGGRNVGGANLGGKREGRAEWGLLGVGYEVLARERGRTSVLADWKYRLERGYTVAGM